MAELKESRFIKGAAAAQPAADVDIGRIVELAIDLAVPEGSQSLMDSPVGVGDTCFSPRKLVRLIQQGASEEDAAHLLACATCSEVASGLGRVNLASSGDFVERALRAAKTKESMKAVRSGESRPLIAILGIGDRIVRVNELDAAFVDVTLDVIPIFETRLISEVELGSLGVTGALVSEQAPRTLFVDTNRDGTPDLLRLIFENVRLAPRVLEGVANHKAVVDTVCISGRIAPDQKEFVAQGVLEFIEPHGRKLKNEALSQKA